jgi:putative transposase
VGWALSNKPDADLVIKALDMAYEQRGRPQGLLFHSDQGSQFGSRHFRQWLWRYRMLQSISRRGIRPHQFNYGLTPAQAEKKLNIVSGIS